MTLMSLARHVRTPFPASRHRRIRSRWTPWSAPCSTRTAPIKEDDHERNEGTCDVQHCDGSSAAGSLARAGGRPGPGPAAREGAEGSLGWSRIHARRPTAFLEPHTGPADPGDVDHVDVSLAGQTHRSTVASGAG